jgi:hypothetical protein
MARSKPYKWIRKEIDTLDPVTDYERIWKLSSVYYVNDFIMDFIYAITFPNFIVGYHGAQAVLRDGKGKVYSEPNRRMDDTARHMLVWWENGPSAVATRRSVASLNNLHAHYATQYPGNFSHNDDYIYTLCYEAALMHRLRLKLGMAGLSEKEQQAAWEFWSRMATLFVNAEDGSALHGFPADFAGINAFIDEYEGRPWPVNPLGHEVGRLMLDPFAQRYFPKPLHGLARTMVLAMYNDTVLRVHQLPRVNPAVRWLCRMAVRAGLTLAEKVLPDPVETLPEIHRRKKAQARSVSRVQSGRCPHSVINSVTEGAQPAAVIEAREASATG